MAMAHLRRFNFAGEFQRAATFHHPPPPPPPLSWPIPAVRIFPTAHGYVLIPYSPYIPPQHYYLSNNNYYATTTTTTTTTRRRSTYHVQEEDQALIFNVSNILRSPRQQEYARRVVQHADRTAAGLSEDQITKCLKIKINNSCPDIANNNRDGPEESDVCVICFDDLCQENNKNNIGVLECGHEYHSDCIRRWLRMKNFCPLCKAVAFKCCPVRSSC
ncbi:PREDICTED: RING finger protein 44-like [Erythranthe guttata]|uniref:RING finger protein 44-like n=1 Tax=Erythranthe guttata TaxID=4155 RepID=UPI00064DFA34|nr:PREDICTED: RING finger protein 44-like [Erythranthe guttata]|eukprot:XP_012833051.1 PREDICTED: RING finger protein 44-like [Erythranthe guttata]